MTMRTETSPTADTMSGDPLVSFVVIARNQVSTIVACLDSVMRTAAVVPGGCEVTYVDSASTDGTLEQVREHFGPHVRMVSLSGAMNAGIARNAGASVSRGRTLFFVDGDMVLEPAFVEAALDARGEPIHGAITGQLPEVLYSPTGERIGLAPDRYRIERREHRAELGGIFIVGRALFEALGGFDEAMRVHEDLDFGLRLARHGVAPLALPQPIATHHTVEYFEMTRLLPMIRNRSLFYPAALFRTHWANPHYWPILASHQRPTAVLLASVALAAAVHPAFLGLQLAYVALKNRRRPHVAYLNDLLGTTARSVCFLVGLVTFFPKRPAAGSVHLRVLEPSPSQSA